MLKSIFSANFSKILDGDLTVFGGPAVAPALAGRMRAAQTDTINRYTPWMMCACIVNAGVLVFTMVGTPLFQLSLLWAGAVSAASLSVLVKWRRGRTLPARASVGVRTIRRAIVNAAVFGAVWGLTPVMFFAGDGQAADLVIACLCAGMMCGGAFALSTIPAAAAAAVLGIAAGAGFSFLTAGNSLHILVGCLLVCYAAVLVKSGVSHANLFAARMLAHFEAERQHEVIGMLLCEFEENASDWLWEIDADQRVVHASARLAQLLGCGAEDLAGRCFHDVIAPQADAADLTNDLERGALLARLKSGTPFRSIVIAVMAGGRRRRWSLTGKPIIGAGGAVEGFRGVGSDVTDAREAEDRIRYLARYDALTGLPNRVLFHEELEMALVRMRRGGEPFALLCLDLDHLKDTNDTVGHAGGDALLVEVAARQRGVIGERDTVGRIGGDEFAIIEAGAGAPERVSRFAQRIAQALAAPFAFNGVAVALSGSIGVAMAPSDGKDADTLLKNADMALYRTKETGRGAHHFFEAAMDEKARDRRQIEADLRQALSQNELRLHYQPLLDISSGLIIGCEALLRWERPKFGLVMPDAFIPLAEETGLIIGMGEWVLNEACKAAASWPSDIRVAVNLSAVQFRSPGLVPVITKALRQSGLPASRLEVEVTESVLISESQTAGAILNTLRLMGVRIALDDFGTGYSSLSYLRKMPFDKIKIDRSFISDLMTHPDCAAIVNALIGLAGNLNMSITAEGVETDAQLAHLRAKGCSEAQGYLIGRPAPVAVLVALLEAQNAMARPAEKAA